MPAGTSVRESSLVTRQVNGRQAELVPSIIFGVIGIKRDDRLVYVSSEVGGWTRDEFCTCSDMGLFRSDYKQ